MNGLFLQHLAVGEFVDIIFFLKIITNMISIDVWEEKKDVGTVVKGYMQMDICFIWTLFHNTVTWMILSYKLGILWIIYFLPGACSPHCISTIIIWASYASKKGQLVYLAIQFLISILINVSEWCSISVCLHTWHDFGELFHYF